MKKGDPEDIVVDSSQIVYFSVLLPTFIARIIVFFMFLSGIVVYIRISARPMPNRKTVCDIAHSCRDLILSV